jgi:glycosyltransferase involved in cell wall biosynthesis
MITPELIASPETAHQHKRMQRHIITPEYPPQPGGVSDYTGQVAEALARRGEDVHVWCPGVPDATVLQGPVPGGVHVHRDLGRVTPQNLRQIDQQLDRFPKPRHILVQYVPHGYGRRTMNVPFCTWLWRRAKKKGDTVDIMVHEAFLTFEGSWRQFGAALVHRLMTVILLQTANRAWFSAQECERRWKPYTFGRHVPFQWLPIPSNIRFAANEEAVRAIRRRYGSEQTLLVGHFGTYGSPVLSVLEPILLKIAQQIPEQPLLLMGISSHEFRQKLIAKQPSLARQLHSTGALAAEELSSHLAACDLLIQPYPDGATSRRGSLMAGISHRKPIITTSSSVMESLWEESAAVDLIPSGDADAFVKRLAELLEDSQERVRLSQAAAKLYLERFDIAHSVEALAQPVPQNIPCVS